MSKLVSSPIHNSCYSIMEEYHKKHTRLSSYRNHQRNILSSYTTYVRDNCEKFSIWLNANSAIESLLLKFLTVCNLIQTLTEIDSYDQEELIQYENLSCILKICHKVNLTNSHIVVRILKMVLNMHLSSTNTGRIRHTIYEDGFLQYVIRHIEIEGIDLNLLISQHSNTVWDFYSQFSVLNAIVNGDRQTLFLLLDSGVQIYPEHEQRQSRQKFPGIPNTLTCPQLLILEIMERIHQKSLFEIDPNRILEEQRTCFKIMWEMSPYILVTKEQFRDTKEQFHVEKEYMYNCGLEKIHENLYRKKRRLVKKYSDDFYYLPETGYADIVLNISEVRNMSF